MAAQDSALRLALKFTLGLAACLALPLLLIWQLPAPPAVAPLWDLANMLGFLTVALTLLLFVYTGRPREMPPFNGRFFAELHRWLGYLVLVLLAAHIGGLLWAEPLVFEYLKPGAPWYMLAGLVSAVLLLLLTATSVPRLRRRLWADYHRFRRVHAVLAAVALVLLCWHVAGSRYYLNTPVKWLLAALGAAAVAGAYLLARFGRRRPRRRVRRLRDTSGHALRVSAAAVLLLVLVAAIRVLWPR